MAVKFAGWGNHQFVIPTTGAPASGYKLYTYVAGSSTLVTTYTTSIGNVAQSNPIILNSAGFPTIGQIWITEGTYIKIVFTDASDVVIKTEDNIPGLNDSVLLSADEWTDGPAPTFISTTSFSLVGDQTSTFHIGRRVKTTNSGGTIYSRISNSVFGALTTVTVVNDSGVLDSGLSAVEYGILSATGDAIPGVEISGDDWTHQGNVTIEGSLTCIDGSGFSITGSSDATKKIQFEVDGLTTATTRTITPPDVNVTLPYKPGTYGSMQVYVANDTWTKPAGLKRVKVTVLAGGAGGGGTAMGTNQAGAAGGAGGCSIKTIEAASLGATETVTVGAAGAGGTAGNNAGTNGGNSSFGAHATATCRTRGGAF